MDIIEFSIAAGIVTTSIVTIINAISIASSHQKLDVIKNYVDSGTAMRREELEQLRQTLQLSCEENAKLRTLLASYMPTAQLPNADTLRIHEP